MMLFAKQNGFHGRFHEVEQVLANFWLLEPEVLNFFSYLSIRNYRKAYLEVLKVIYSFLAPKLSVRYMVFLFVLIMYL